MARGVTMNKKKKLKIYMTSGVIFLLAWVLIYFNLGHFSKWFTYQFLNLKPDTRFSSAVEFFAFDAPKVLLLLTIVVFVVGIIRSFFTPDRTRKILAGKKELIGNILAALLGVATPFCTCSAVPLFIGFVTTGIPLGVTFSFLISAPLINEVALVLLYGLFGYKVALIYLSTGLLIAIISGWIIGKLYLEKYIEEWVFETKASLESKDTSKTSLWVERIEYGVKAVDDIVGKVWIYILIGLAVGAWIHGYVPEDFMASIMGKEAWWSVPLGVLIGVPMYSNAAAIIPIVQALLEKGAALGTALAFMMAVIGLSLPEFIILRKVLKLRLIIIFVSIVTFGILVVGYLFNVLI